VLDKSLRRPCRHQDGVSVAKEIELKDKFEGTWSADVKEVASNTSDEAGDGTTTATLLAQAIIREGLKSVAAGANPMDLKRGIDQAVIVATEELKKLSKPCKDRKRSHRSARSPRTPTRALARRLPMPWRRSARKV